MKKIFILAAMICFGQAMNAQTVISNESLTHDGKNVTVTFDVDTDVKGIPSRRKEVIIPYIYNGKDTVYLDAVEVYGKGRYKRERQVNHIAGDKDWELGDNQTLKGDVYSYRDQTPLKRWMKPANLGIRRQLVGCACEKDRADENIAEASLFEEPALPPRRTPAYALVDAAREWDFGQDELEIIFKVSKIEIDSSVFNNEITFGKILAAVDKIFSDPKYRMDKIEVAGYASPEGSIAFNKWLGINRAKALISYIIGQRPQYNLTEDDFVIRNGEENWPGLKRVLKESSMSEKQTVIDIIDSDATNDQKKLAIKSLDGGKVWKKMLDEIYPHLRSARCLAVYYDSTNDEAVDAVNAANDLIDEGKYAEAYEMVKPYDDDMRAYNTLGVALMMQGEFEKAMPWFEKAVSVNADAAQKNIDAINAEYEYEAEQKRILAEYLKQYE